MATSTLKESSIRPSTMSDVEIVAKTPLSTLPASTSQKNIAATDIVQFSPFVELNLTDPDEAIRATLNPDEVTLQNTGKNITCLVLCAVKAPVVLTPLLPYRLLVQQIHSHLMNLGGGRAVQSVLSK
jgi:hypothetical protein